MNERFTEMLGVLAHEMRTPIAAIIGYQELLAEGIFGDIDPRGQEPLARIAYSAKQLLHLIDGVQEISVPAAKRLGMVTQPFDPAPVLRDCVRNAATDAHGRSIKLHADFDNGLPRMSGDPDRFCRAVDLALAAAIKTSHGATLDVGARAVGEQIHVSIAGTGLQPGRDDPPAIHVQDTGRQAITGAGLRLAIVRHIAQQMRGDIALRAERAGTTLVLQVPTS